MNPPSPGSIELWDSRDNNGLMVPTNDLLIPTSNYLPIELWRCVFHQVIDENENVAQIDHLDMAQLGPAPFERFHPDISNSVTAWSLGLVCHLWRDLSEEVRYRHLYVSDINSIERMKMLVSKSTWNRKQLPSSLDPRHRTRGWWTYSLTVTASCSGTVPSSLNSAHSFHLGKSLIALLSWLPNIRQFVSSLAFAPNSRVLSSLPKSVNHLSFGEGGIKALRFLHREACTRIFTLEVTTSGDMQGYPIQLTNLVCLSINPQKCIITDWETPKLSFLSITLSPGDEAALSDSIMQKLGANLRRVELRNVGDHQIAIRDDFLQWCPQLETLLFDFFGFTFLDDANPHGTRSFSSIRILVLVIKDWAQFLKTRDAPPYIELNIRTSSLSQLISRTLPNLAHIFASFSRVTLLSGADIRHEMECQFKAHIRVPFSVVWY